MEFDSLSIYILHLSLTLCHSSLTCSAFQCAFLMFSTAMSIKESKPYYKEYFQESDREYSATDALCWDVMDCRVRSGEVLSEAGINTYVEHLDKKDPSHWWVITTPNRGYIPTAPIGIQQLQARADGR